MRERDILNVNVIQLNQIRIFRKCEMHINARGKGARLIRLVGRQVKPVCFYSSESEQGAQIIITSPCLSSNFQSINLYIHALLPICRSRFPLFKPALC